MRIGLALPTYGSEARAEAIVSISRSAEDMGYDSLWTGDRLLAPVSPTRRYPGPGGVLPPDHACHLDPLTALVFSAAHTSRVRLGTSTLNGLWQSPVMLARTLTTLDVLSGGRLDVGLGLGWMPEEYTAANVPWDNRGARLDETLDVLEKYWTHDRLVHEGPLFSVPEALVGLKSTQSPRPPILLAALGPTGLRRVARRADGWLAGSMPVPRLMGVWAETLKAAEAAERDSSALRIALRVNPEFTDAKVAPERVPICGSFTQYVDYARAAAEAGVHELFIDFGHTPTSLNERVDLAGRFIEGVMAG
ncbi:monooxygenase [Streptomyces sp. 150FB]|uniref:TIGR03619 family F420-dependent LLM class oxidoreductase n=1 Tax=Streptomyces sp. 150FB TaxID=1576605 RepID=UPI000589465B|nr:TIGR03619 family F420-dependent LLM class oxidoreductase [Streptomyces sp. 150FB]KIF73400.1 monooxygenase [Streptomyces sp. 150FB]